MVSLLSNKMMIKVLTKQETKWSTMLCEKWHFYAVKEKSTGIESPRTFSSWAPGW